MAGWLGVPLGVYHHHVDSLHLYAQHDELASQIAVATVGASPAMPALTAPAEGLTDFLTAVVAGTPAGDAGPVWSALAAVLASYRQWADGDRPAARAVATGITGDLGQALRGWYDHLAPAAEPAGTPGGAR